MSGSFRIGVLIAALVIFADQATKSWALSYLLQHSGVVKLTSFFNLVVTFNRGISFGLLQANDSGRWLLIATSLVIVVVLAIWLWRATGWLLPVALGAVIGGALGNVADRLGEKKAVFDFLDFHLFGYHWPAFNLADSAISIGVGLILIDGLFVRARHSDDSVKSSEGGGGNEVK